MEKSQGINIIADSLKECTLCPRDCKVDRTVGQKGYCGTGSEYSISSITMHKGEEPVISGKIGICNIFFTGCNLRCIFCQNFQISRPDSSGKKMNILEITGKIIPMLNSGMKTLGFVSTSHVVPQVVEIIHALNKAGFHPITVYNTNAYEKADTIKQLEGLIDIYLPDLKYKDSELSSRYSDAPDYFLHALPVIKEMYRQKGSYLSVDDDGQAENGMLIRHLVLPGHSDDSIQVLKSIAEEISTKVHISLMSQYFPADQAVIYPNLKRKLYTKEYSSVAVEMSRLGFQMGWTQEMDSAEHYFPDFNNENPFN